MHAKRTSASRFLRLLAATAVLHQACGPSPSDIQSEGRRILTARWDTVYTTGTSGQDDGLIADFRQIIQWGDRVIVADGVDKHILAFDRSGRLEWVVGSSGAGPEEFGTIDDVVAYGADTLWVVDQRHGRISQWSPRGDFLGTISISHLSPLPSRMVVLDDKIVLVQDRAQGSVSVVGSSYDGFPLLSRLEEHPWADSLESIMWLYLETARLPSAPSTWVGAFMYGPGFMVFRGEEVARHMYVVPGRFGMKSPNIMPTEDLRQRALRDSVVYGAASIAGTDSMIFMLAGGRPPKAAHPEMKPTRFVDLYGWDGEYHGSYYTPFHSLVMTTDGDTFVFGVDEPYPHLVALRPIR